MSCTFAKKVVGSPPRVWGIPHIPLRGHRRTRFTPTCVGNTFSTRSINSSTSVHPHVCGEYDGTGLSYRVNDGSPPRVWGIPPLPPTPVPEPRFTPTCVGNTHDNLHYQIFYTVHPHVCGEYSIPRYSKFHFNGSPPRVWGIRGMTRVLLKQ